MATSTQLAPHYYYPGWWEGGPQLSLYVNQKAYDGLNPEYKAMIAAASTAAGVDLVAKYDYRNPGALKQLVAGGAKLERFPNDMMASAFKAANEVYDELNATNPAWKKIYSDMIVTTGGGGALLSDDPALIERVRFLATQARVPVLPGTRLTRLSRSSGVRLAGRCALIFRAPVRRPCRRS